MIDFATAFIAVIIAFIAGMTVGRPRGNFKPIERSEYDENWIRQPPPFHIGDSAGEKPPTVITHLYAPWKNPK